MFLSLTPKGTWSISVHRKRSILGDLLEVSATFLSPSQPGCNIARWAVWEGEGEGKGKAVCSTEPSGSASRPAHVHTSYALLNQKQRHEDKCQVLFGYQFIMEFLLRVMKNTWLLPPDRTDAKNTLSFLSHRNFNL